MKPSTRLLSCFILLIPFLAFSQVPPAKDSLAKHDSTLLASKDTLAKPDTVKPVAVAKNCYAEWQDAFRSRGAKPVTDGMQQVVIALKDSSSCHCYMGQVEVVNGKIKP